ncbi:MAG: DnaD domain protein [Bacillota bacterium]|nr:DnaD domain protein [Bacillota bacterium]
MPSLFTFRKRGDMMSAYIESSSADYIKVSSRFIDKFLPCADGTFVKVYLLGLRQCSNGTSLTDEGIACSLDILESDVHRAWKYWESQGVISLSKDEKGNRIIAFRDLSDEIQKSLPLARPGKPEYSSAEISSYAADHAEMRELLRHAETSLGKPLSSNDQSTIFSLHDWLGLPIEVVTLLINYCVSIGKKSMRSIELMAINWSEHDIDSLEKAEKYLVILQENNSKISSYRRAIGIYDRMLTKAEADYLSEWAYKLNSPVELVKLAAEITALNTGKISLPYMNTMLQDWYSKGIKSAADARAMRNEFKKQTSCKDTKKSGGFNDYSCKTEYDYAAIERSALHFNKKDDN